MENLGIKIKEYRKANNLSMPDLSALTGIPKDRIYKWEKGTIPYITSEVESLIALINNGTIPQTKTITEPTNLIPYFPDINASAGLDFLTDNSQQNSVMINIPNVDAQAFINVFGDSMYPKYCSGEIIGLKQVDKDYVMFGQAYVIQMKNGEAYLKYIKAGKDDSHWILANENKSYEPREFHLNKIDKVFIIKAVITKTTL